MTTRPSQLSQDIAHAMNLLAHPLAGWAAMSAIGLGIATQAWGLWAGTVLGAMEGAGRLGHDAPHAGGKRETVAAVKARAAAVSLMAEAQSLAREVAEDAPQPAAASPAERARRVRPTASARRAPAARPQPAASAAPAAGGEAAGRPAVLAKPRKPDDLKRIPGIGPKLEQVLNGLGIWTFGQIAGWSDADVAWVEDQLGLSGRIARDGWVAEARKLGAGRKR